MIHRTKTGPQLTVNQYAVSSQDALPRPKDQRATDYESIREMRCDPTISLARRLTAAPMLNARWSIEATDEAPEGAFELIDRVMLPMRMHILQQVVHGCLDFGWIGFEKVFHVDDDGSVCLKKLKPLLHDITDILIDPKTGAYKGLVQFYRGSGTTIITGEEVRLNLEESWLINIDVEGTNWYGRSVMLNAESVHDKWNKIEEAADRYDNKVAGSTWVVYYPPGKSEVNGVLTDNYTIANQILRSLEATGTMAVPTSVDEMVDSMNKDSPQAWKIELVSDMSNARAHFIERQSYLDKLKVRAFGFPERAILEGEFGTKAEAVAHGDFAIANMQLLLDYIVQQLNWHVVNQMLRLNWGVEYENTVYIEAAPIADITLGYLRDIYQAILTKNDDFEVDVDAVRDKLGVPTLPKEDEPDQEELIEVDNIGGEDIAKTALNGAQIASLIAIAEQVAAKGLPAETAKAIIKEAFPNVSETAVNEIIDPLAAFEPPQVEDDNAVV